VTKDIFAHQWPEIEAVAAALMQHTRLTGAQVRAAIEATLLSPAPQAVDTAPQDAGAALVEMHKMAIADALGRQSVD
jgi:hypothetical protein